ncbi:helix-turn-helix domain-containing protein [Chryseobacterium sp.]|uniref:helix-turn-helix domain-containing protein n=1 Tax=Chryseobacterium sp. TaxID=1871047 RepID=UPI0028A0D950|nr:helix-turn-helix domain-containing protein [Chryseobacterium sp.]
MKTDFKKTEKKQSKNLVFHQKLWKKTIPILLILLNSVFISGQSGPDFSVLADKAFQKLYQNPDDCINYSLSILISDQNNEHKIVLRNIISQAYAMKGDYVQSVNISSQKDDSDKENLSYFMQLFADYNLADQYQNLDLYNQSQKIISSLLINKKLLNSENIKIKTTVAKLYQLQALNFGINRNYILALENIAKSDSFLTVNNEENTILKIENKIFRAAYLSRQNKLEQAKNLLENALLEAKNTNYSYLEALAYENLARYYFSKEDYQTSIVYLEKGLSEIENLPFNNLKSRIYESLSKCYFALHDDEKHHFYNKLYVDSRTKIDASTKEGIRYIVKLVETYQNKNLEFQRQNESKKFWFLFFIILLIVIGLTIWFLIIKNRNKDLKKQFDFFEKQKKWEKSHAEILIKKESDVIEKTTDKDSNKISKEKEEEILQKLEEFEQSDRFLNKNMSLSTLSAQMEVNTKYLSEVINNHKGKNFNGYINELRINHIAHLLKSNPSYLNYKVSYLAEISGFSSHSAFTTVFKSVTGMSPNVYIQEISKNRAL